jgi:hypothetical protein
MEEKLRVKGNRDRGKIKQKEKENCKEIRKRKTMTAVSFQITYFPISLKLVSPRSVQATFSTEGNRSPNTAVNTHQSRTETEEYFIMCVKFENKFLQHSQMLRLKLGKRNEY